MHITFSPSTEEGAALRQAASLYGVEPEYYDIWGHKHVVDPEVVRSILATLGVRCATLEEVNAAIEARLIEEWSQLAPPTTVAFEDATAILLTFLNEAAGACSVTLHCESGETKEWEASIEALEPVATAELAGRHYVRRLLQLPAGVPTGYHSVEVRSGALEQAVRLIVTPRRAFLPEALADGKKVAGISVSVYGLRSGRNWGCGDTRDLKDLVGWAAKNGLSFVALNPLHTIPNRQPYNASPYLPTSILYRNLLYLDASALGIGEPATAAALRAAEYVEYEKVYKLKRKALRAAFRRFLREHWASGTAEARAFQQYICDEGDSLRRYATYCALDEWFHRENPNVWLWTDWPREFHDPNSAPVTEFVTRHWRMVLFYQFAQWHLDRQLAEVQRHALELGMPIGLYHDLALATDRTGADVWAHPGFYRKGCRVGSPPDEFAPEGQDWAFPPPNTERHYRDGYRLFAEGIRKTATRGGALRIDHVMRLFRLFWIPDGHRASSGAYVLDRAANLLKVIALESHRARVVVIGEDLGTVSDETRVALADYGILSYRLLFFEKHLDGSFRQACEYPEQALASTTTHDLPTLAGFWSGRDIEVRRGLGLIPDDDSAARQLAARRVEKARIAEALGLPGAEAESDELSDAALEAVVRFLASTPCLMFALNQEDLTKSEEQLNVPGTTHEHPNWRRKMKYSIEELDSNPEAAVVGAILRKCLEESGRSHGETVAPL